MSEVTKKLPDGRTIIINIKGKTDAEASAFISRFLPLVVEEVIQTAAEKVEE